MAIALEYRTGIDKVRCHGEVSSQAMWHLGISDASEERRTVMQARARSPVLLVRAKQP